MNNVKVKRNPMRAPRIRSTISSYDVARTAIPLVMTSHKENRDAHARTRRVLIPRGRPMSRKPYGKLNTPPPIIVEMSV